MSLRGIEKRLESFFEGLFAKGFKTAVQPVELAKKLVKEMDSHKTISVGRVYAPNQYKISISMQDVKSLKPFEGVLLSDLAEYLMSHAKQQKFTLTVPPSIEIAGDESLSLGEVNIQSTLTAADEEAEKKDQTQIILPEEAKEAGVYLRQPAYLLLQDPAETLTFPLIKKTTVLGRLHTNDIVLEDLNVSRVHAEIKQEDIHFTIYDLGSTNGTFVNGKPQKKWILQDGDTIILGETELLFKE